MQEKSTGLMENEAAGAPNADRLARQLIRHLGVAGAVRTCRENHWDGVLNAVETHAAQLGAL